MANILIFGAGSMGTAFSFVCSDNNHSVSIIGTHLENDFIDQINSSRKHPVLDCEIPKDVKFLKFEKFKEEVLMVVSFSASLACHVDFSLHSKQTIHQCD